MRSASPMLSWVLAGGLAVAWVQADRSQGFETPAETAKQGRARGEPTPEVPVVPRAPDTVAEGEVWIPPLPTMEKVAPPPGWVTSGPDVPPLPLTALRLPRTNITRAKYPAIDFHVHAGSLNAPQAYRDLIELLDNIGVGAIVNLNGGTGERLDAVIDAGRPYRDRVANFITFSAEGINEPGWSQRFAAEMERAFQKGAVGMKVSKRLGLTARNPGGSLIQADDPRLDPIWEMAARYDKPVMIHLSDSVGRSVLSHWPKERALRGGSLASTRRYQRQLLRERSAT